MTGRRPQPVSALPIDVAVRFERGAAAHEYTFRTADVITGVFGSSGAGKTTLLHLLAGLLRPTGGSIRIGEQVLFDDARGVDVPPHRRRLGVVFQDDRLLPHLSVEGNLRYGARRGTPGIATGDVLDLLSLRPFLRRRVRTLSGGERQRVALGRALLSQPKLLLLDEPLTSLDGEHKREILGLVTRIRDTLAIPTLYVTHDLTELLEVTDRLLIVDGGRCVAHGPLREVVRQTTAWRVVRGLGPVNVLPLILREQEKEAGLSVFAVAGAAPDAGDTLRLRGPLVDREPPWRVRATVRPEDVALSLHPLTGISIQNQLPGRVEHVATHPDRAVVEVDVGVRLLVEVSHRTVSQMTLAPGRPVCCLIKSNAIRYVDA